MASDAFTRDLFDWLWRIGHDVRVEGVSAKLAIVIASHMNRRTQEAYPGQALLARTLGVSERTIRRALADLQRHGHLEVEHAGARQVNRYRIAGEGRPDRTSVSYMTGQEWPVTEPVDRSPVSGQDADDRPDLSGRSSDRPSMSYQDEGDRTQVAGQNCDDRTSVSYMTGHACPPNYLNEPSEEVSKKENPLTPSPGEGSSLGDCARSAREAEPLAQSQALTTTKPRKPPHGALTEAEQVAFDAWWVLYPRKVAKAAATPAWLKQFREGVDQSIVNARTMAYASERAGKDPQHTAHAATWLNGRRWEDEITTQPPGGYRPPATQHARGIQGFSAIDHAVAMGGYDEEEF